MNTASTTTLAVVWQNTDSTRARNKIFKIMTERYQYFFDQASFSIPESRYNRQDFMQEAHITTMGALDTFDVNKGCTFTTWLAWQLKGTVWRFSVYQANLVRPNTRWVAKIAEGKDEAHDWPKVQSLNVTSDGYREERMGMFKQGVM